MTCIMQSNASVSALGTSEVTNTSCFSGGSAVTGQLSREEGVQALVAHFAFTDETEVAVPEGDEGPPVV